MNVTHVSPQSIPKGASDNRLKSIVEHVTGSNIPRIMLWINFNGVQVQYLPISINKWNQIGYLGWNVNAVFVPKFAKLVLSNYISATNIPATEQIVGPKYVKVDKFITDVKYIYEYNANELQKHNAQCIIDTHKQNVADKGAGALQGGNYSQQLLTRCGYTSIRTVRSDQIMRDYCNSIDPKTDTYGVCSCITPENSINQVSKYSDEDKHKILSNVSCLFDKCAKKGYRPLGTEFNRTCPSLISCTQTLNAVNSNLTNVQMSQACVSTTNYTQNFEDPQTAHPVNTAQGDKYKEVKKESSSLSVSSIILLSLTGATVLATIIFMILTYFRSSGSSGYSAYLSPVSRRDQLQKQLLQIK